MPDDVVAELEALINPRNIDHVLTLSALLTRARDEIVALRGSRAECERQFQAQVAEVGRLLDHVTCPQVRAEALEEAATACLRKARDHVIPMGQDNYHDGCLSCAAAIRALKEKREPNMTGGTADAAGANDP